MGGGNDLELRLDGSCACIRRIPPSLIERRLERASVEVDARPNVDGDDAEVGVVAAVGVVDAEIEVDLAVRVGVARQRNA